MPDITDKKLHITPPHKIYGADSALIFPFKLFHKKIFSFLFQKSFLKKRAYKNFQFNGRRILTSWNALHGAELFFKKFVLASRISSFIHPVRYIKFSLNNNLRAFTCAVLRFCSHHLHILFGFSLRSARAKAFSVGFYFLGIFSRLIGVKSFSVCSSYFLSVFSLGMVIFFLGIPSPSFGDGEACNVTNGFRNNPACPSGDLCVFEGGSLNGICRTCPCSAANGSAGYVYTILYGCVPRFDCGSGILIGTTYNDGFGNTCSAIACTQGVHTHADINSCGYCGSATTSCTVDSDCPTGQKCAYLLNQEGNYPSASSLDKKCVDPTSTCPCGVDYTYITNMGVLGSAFAAQGITTGSGCAKICTESGGKSSHFQYLTHPSGARVMCSPRPSATCPVGQTKQCDGTCTASTCTPACQPDEDCTACGTCMPKCRSDQVRNATTCACECPSGYTNTDSCKNEVCALDSCATGKGIKISTTDGSQSCHSGGSNACPSGLEEITFGDVTFCLGEKPAGSGQYVYPDGVARSLCTGSDEMRLPGDNYTNCNTCCGSTQELCGGICVAQCRIDQIRDPATCQCICPSGETEIDGECTSTTCNPTKPSTFVPGAQCSYDYEGKVDDKSTWEIDPIESIKESALKRTFCENPGEKCYYSYQQQGSFNSGDVNYHGTCVKPSEENDPSYMKALCHYHCGSTDPICNSFDQNSSAINHRGRRTITWNRKDGSVSQDVSQKAARLTCTTCPYGTYTNEDTNILGGRDCEGCKNLNTTCPDTEDFMHYKGNKVSSTQSWCYNACEKYQGLVNLLHNNKWSKGIYWHRGDYSIYPICEISGERRGYEKNGSCQSACPPGQLLTCRGCLDCGPGKVLCGKTCVINSDGTATPSNCCVPECTGGRIMDNDCTCICPDSNKEWCAGTNQCVDLCKNGKIRDPSTCTCACEPPKTVQAHLNGDCGYPPPPPPQYDRTILDTFGGNPAVPSGMWASSFNLQGSPAFRSVYTIGRADRPDFICWKKTTTTGAVDTILPHYFCPERQSCALGEDCPCQTVHGKEVPDTYCDYANMDPMRGYSEPEPVQGAVDHPINVGVKSITINVVPP